MMRQAVAGEDGRRTVILGVTDADLRGLIAREPIALELRDMGLPGCRLIVVHGATEPLMLQKVQRLGTLHGMPDAARAYAEVEAEVMGEPRG